MNRQGDRCCSAFAYWASTTRGCCFWLLGGTVAPACRALQSCCGRGYEATAGKARTINASAFGACPLYQVKSPVLKSPGRER